jgi:hypothetical protein
LNTWLVVTLSTFLAIILLAVYSHDRFLHFEHLSQSKLSSIVFIEGKYVVTKSIDQMKLASEWNNLFIISVVLAFTNGAVVLYLVLKRRNYRTIDLNVGTSN